MTTYRILVLEPGQPLEERSVEAVLGLIGGYATNLPQWVFPTPQNVSAIGREFNPGENAPDNFLSYEHATTIRGTMILMAYDDDGETVDLTDEQVADLTKTVGRLERSPAIETKRPSDRFTLVMLDEDHDTGEKFSENYGSMSSPWVDDQ